MPSNLNHLLYIVQVRELNSNFRKLSLEGGKDVTEIAKKAVLLASQFLLENSQEYLEAFSNQSTVLFTKNDFEASRGLLMQMVDRVDIDLLDENEKRVYSSILNNLGVCYFKLGNFRQAAKYIVRSYGLKKKLKYGYYDMTGLAEDLAESYIRLGEAEKAIYYWSDLTEIAAAEFGKNSYEYLDSLADLFNFLDNNGFDAEANDLNVVYTELENRLNNAKLLGNDYDSAVKEAIRQYDLGNFTFAQQIHERIVASTPVLPSPLSTMALLGHTLDPVAIYAGKLDMEALSLQNKKDFSNAIKLYIEIIEIIRTSLGKDNLRLGYALNNLGDARIAAGDFVGAKESLLQCLMVMNHPLNRKNEKRLKMIENYVIVVYNMSLSYAPEIDSAEKVTEEFAKSGAPAEYARSLRIRMVIPKENEPFTETMIRRFEARAAFYESIGNYKVVLRLLEDIADLCSVYYAFEPEKAIEARLALANGYVHQNDFSSAEKIYLSTLSFVQENLSSDSYEYFFVIYTSGIFYSETGEYTKARRFLEKALAICQQFPDEDLELQRRLKRDLIAVYHRDPHSDSRELIRELLKQIKMEDITDSAEIQDFASYYAELMELEKAEALYKKAILLIKEQKGEWNLEYALAISNLANTFRFQMKFDEALTLYLQSLRIREIELGLYHPKLVPSLEIMMNETTLFRRKLTHCFGAN